MRGKSRDDIEGSSRVCLHLRVTCFKQTCTENPERLRQLTACSIVALFVFKTNQDKRALKYKFGEEKLSDFFFFYPSLSLGFL